MKSSVLVSLLIVCILSSFIQNTYGDTTGALSPTTAISTVSSINDFTNRNNAFTSNNLDARGQNNDDQAYGGFGGSIPSNATVNGITINLEGDRDECASGDNPRFRVQLSTPSLVGDPTGLGSFTSTTQTTTNLGAGDSIRTLGGSSDMWGLSYTPTQLSNLWVMITILCGSSNDDIKLDHFTVEVTYTMPPPPPPPDTTPPVLTILGSNPLNHTINTPYADAGATAIDNIDGDITANIIVTNGVDENVLGTYIVNYFIEDLAGNNSTSNRTVNVVNIIIPPPPPSNSTSITTKGDSCNDCISPTLGVDENNKERVSGGFTYKNGFSADDFFISISRDFISQTVNVNYFRTPFPAIGTEVGINNTLILKIYEDSGVNNIRHVAVGFGLDKNGRFSESKAYIEADRDFKGNISIKTFGVVSNVTYTTNIVPCGIVRADCLEFTLYHTFTEDVSGVVGTYIWDNRLNSWQNYFNDGINVKDNKVVIEEPEPVKIDEDKLKGVSSFGYFQRGTYAFDNYKQSQADEAKEMFNSLYGRINNWD